MNQEPRRQIQRENSWHRLTMKLMDAFSIVLGLYLMVNWLPSTNSKSTIVIALVAVGLFYFSAELVGLYRNWRGIAFEKEAATALLAWSATLVALSVLGQLSIYSTELSSRNLMIWFALTPTLSLAIRISSRWYVAWRQRNSVNTRSYAVVGINELGLHLVRNVDTTPELGLKFLGYYDDRVTDRTINLPDDASVKLGKLDELIRAAKRGDVQVIYITLPMRAEERIRGLIQELADTTASVYIVPDLFVFQMLNSRWTDIQGLPVVSVFENPLYGVDGAVKRCVDFAWLRLDCWLPVCRCWGSPPLLSSLRQGP